MNRFIAQTSAARSQPTLLEVTSADDEYATGIHWDQPITQEKEWRNPYFHSVYWDPVSPYRLAMCKDGLHTQ